MTLVEQTTAYLRQPFVVVDAALAATLATAGQQRLTHATGLTASQYSVANCLHAVAAEVPGIALGTGLPRLEFPDWSRLAGFYEEHGLEPMAANELAASQADQKLRCAWNLLESVPAVGASLRALVRTITVLRSPDPEIDVSYSHPAVPFSVFVSVGEDAALISSLRVAESLLHEAMHLQLTLLEQETALVEPGSQRLHYSPWRDEERPIRGVLHGLFVFAAVREFYCAMRRRLVADAQAADFIADRIATITQELSAVTNFAEVPDLTAAGKVLVWQLLNSGKGAESP